MDGKTNIGTKQETLSVNLRGFRRERRRKSSFLKTKKPILHGLIKPNAVNQLAETLLSVAEVAA